MNPGSVAKLSTSPCTTSLNHTPLYPSFVPILFIPTNHLPTLISRPISLHPYIFLTTSLSLSIPLFTPISYHLFSLYPFIPIILFLRTHQTRPSHPLSSTSCMHPISIKSIVSCPCLILSHMHGSLHYPSKHPSNPFSHSKTFSYPLSFPSPPSKNSSSWYEELEKLIWGLHASYSDCPPDLAAKCLSIVSDDATFCF
ncbi:unnamed protein product, partial [Vitis vinifera]